MISSFQLKEHLPRTWSPFFARHGTFTEVQQQAIPHILAGDNVLLISATASGKTEAAIAPLIERHCSPPVAQPASLRILYISPTRALVRDLYERLRPPLEMMQIPLAMKSGDTGPVSTRRPPTVLITTPESTDVLLTRSPRLLAALHAVVLDEIHLFDGGPRGDHLRCLLRRIEYVRSYRQQEIGAEETPLQRIALSATVPDPEGVAARYMEDGTAVPCRIVDVPGARSLLAALQPLVGLADLVRALHLRAVGQAGIRKTLIFCNTRNEVEDVAAYLRRHLPYEAALFVHYSNLDPAMRLAVEEQFAEATVAICVSSSTLELGIDIGTIDDVVLVGPPPTLTSFLQRIGRGGRRTGVTRVLCLPRSVLEEVRFRALVEMAESAAPAAERGAERVPSDTYHFLPSVLVQQTGSILAQSPTGGIRLADLRRATPDEVDDATLRSILDHLAVKNYLRPGRLGEWRAGPALDELVDAYEIYSNIGGDPLSLVLVDAYSGRPIAQTGGIHLQGDLVRMGGRTLEVVWRDRYRIGVRRVEDHSLAEELRFHTTPFAVPLAVSQAVAAYLGVPLGQMALISLTEGAWLFHFWGDLYGALLAEILRDEIGYAADELPVTPINEHCLYLPAPIAHLPPWTRFQAHRQLPHLLPRIEPFLELGRFHSLLPPDVARRTMIARCDLPRFEQLYRSATIHQPPPALRARLEMLL